VNFTWQTTVDLTQWHYRAISAASILDPDYSGQLQEG
jgi:hypothetical protein